MIWCVCVCVIAADLCPFGSINWYRLPWLIRSFSSGSTVPSLISSLPVVPQDLCFTWLGSAALLKLTCHIGLGLPVYSCRPCRQRLLQGRDEGRFTVCIPGVTHRGRLSHKKDSVHAFRMNGWMITRTYECIAFPPQEHGDTWILIGHWGKWYSRTGRTCHRTHATGPAGEIQVTYRCKSWWRVGEGVAVSVTRPGSWRIGRRFAGKKEAIGGMAFTESLSGDKNQAWLLREKDSGQMWLMRWVGAPVEMLSVTR